VAGQKPQIGIFGAGWVGLVTGACFAELGHDVVVRDVVPERIGALQSGRVPLHEPGLEELLERNRERLTFTLDVADVVSAPLMFVCVGTPRTYSGDADLSAVWSVVDELPEFDEHSILVMKSTVPVGTGEKVRTRLDARGLTHVGYAANPEFLAEGSAVRDFMNPDRVVVGAYTEADAAAVAALYETLDAPVVRADVSSAEMIKLAANAFLMTRISFINEIANVCEATGADVVQVAEGVGLDRRLGPHFLRAGIGWGGSCFPKDGVALKQLASNSGYHFQLLNAVIEVNELQKRRVVGKLEKHLGKLRGKTVALLGLAFKPNTDDLREAPSLVLASRLLAEGADVRAWDPVADARELLQGVTFSDSVRDAVTDADAAVIVTEWEELRGLASEETRVAMRRPVIVDGRNVLDPEQVRAAGFVYEGIGRAAPSLPDLPETEERSNLPGLPAPRAD
jgi:UDPglucose 6-dehydrogenase